MITVTHTHTGIGMGSSASIHNSDTFLTACDFDDGYGWEMPEASDDGDDDDEGDEDNDMTGLEDDKNDPHGSLMSVGTEVRAVTKILTVSFDG